MASNVPPTNSPSRSPRPAARPSGSSRRFGRELFLGNFRLDLIHPQPAADRRAGRRRARRSSQRLRAFLDRARRPARRSSATRKIPDDVIDGLKELGALGHEDPRGVRRPRPHAGLLQPRAGAGGHLARARSRRCSPRTSRSACPSRCGCSAPRSRSASGCRRSPRDHISAFLLTEPDVGSDPARMSATAVPDRGRHRLPHQRHQAVGDQRRDRRRRRGHGRRPEDRGPQGRHHRLHLPVRPRRHHGRAPQRVHGPARHRELA